MGISTNDFDQRHAFALWLRTGRRPTVCAPGIELKFNPWHDPDDGKFTRVGAGRYFGLGSPRSAGRDEHRRRPTTKNDSRGSPARGTVAKVGEFIRGARNGTLAAGKDAVDGLYRAATTDPATTIRNFGESVAKSIDAAITAEDVPAIEQARRAKRVAANASAYDLGYATGQVGTNVAIAAVPGAAASKISAVRVARALRPRETFRAPALAWPKETIGKKGPAKTYNDTAVGARAGHAPALMRRVPDGSSRPVKFDGIDGDYVIDRKWKIVDLSNARAQALRQSEVLSQHKLIGIWEVPNDKQRIAALNLLKKAGIKNIKVRIIHP